MNIPSRILWYILVGTLWREFFGRNIGHEYLGKILFYINSKIYIKIIGNNDHRYKMN